jgi:hypothetical protein
MNDQSNGELQKMLAQLDSNLDAIVQELDNQQVVAELLKNLIQSEHTADDFMLLMKTNRIFGEKILMSALSSLISVHSRAQLKKELVRRAEEN